MLISEAYIRFADFVTQAINDSTVTIYLQGQKAPRDTKPFITIAIGTIGNVDFPMKYEVDDNGIQLVVLNKTFGITLNAYADILHQPEELLNTVQDKLRTDFAYYHFRGDMAYIDTALGVSALPVAIDGKNESRAILELRFNSTQEVYDDVGLIDHIIIEDETTGNDIIINR